MVLNYERLLDSCDNDKELIREVIAEYFLATAESIRKLEEAISTDSIEQVRFHAHSLKGSSRTIGAEDLGQVCATLELQSKESDLSHASEFLKQIRREYDQVQTILVTRARELAS